MDNVLVTCVIVGWLLFELETRICFLCWSVFFFQAEDGIRDLVRSRGLGDVYKRQPVLDEFLYFSDENPSIYLEYEWNGEKFNILGTHPCLLYTSDAADERSSVDLGGRRIIKKKKQADIGSRRMKNKKKREQPMIIHNR